MRSPSLASVCLLKKAHVPSLSFRSGTLHGIVHSVNHIITRIAERRFLTGLQRGYFF